MLAHALAHERMFCVALLRPESAQWKSEDDFFDVGTIGLIRACVGRGNGASNLILQGLQRVCFADFVQLHPFPIAEFETLRSDNETTVETDALGAKVLELYARFKTLGRQLPTKIDRYVTDMTDLAMLADLMASTFIEDPVRRQQVLEELDLNTRLRLVIQYLRDETGNAAA
jgi:ATP-dependent Lon protease